MASLADTLPEPSRLGGGVHPDRVRLRLGSLFGGLVLTAISLSLLAYAVRGGMVATHLLRECLMVALTQLLPGALTWRAARPRRGWWVEDLVMGFAIGSVVAIAAQVLAGLSRQYWLSWAPGVALAAVLLAVPATRRRAFAARCTPLPWWWGTSVGALMLLALPQLRDYFRVVPLNWASGARTTHVDAYLHLALSAELARRGPVKFPWVQSEDLAYHWFSHAWVAQVAVSSDVPLDETLFRFMAVLMPIVAIATASIVAVRLSGLAVAGPIAGLLTWAGADLDVWGVLSPHLPVTPLSPSLGLSVPILLAMVVVLALHWKGRLARPALVLLPILAFASAGSKGSTLPVVVVGVGLALVACLLFRRELVRRVLVDLVLLVASLVLAVVVVFHGSDAGLTIDPSAAAKQTSKALVANLDPSIATVVLLAIAVLGVLTRAAGMIALPFSATWRREPVTWLLIGSSLAGAGALGIFTHPGASQWYFALSAGPLMAIGSTLGLVASARALGSIAWRPLAIGVVGGPLVLLVPLWSLGALTHQGQKHVFGLIGLGIVIVLLLGVGAMLLAGGVSGQTKLRIGAVAALTAIISAGLAFGLHEIAGPISRVQKNVSVRRPLATSRDQIDAARWIRDHSGVDDVVMTNRHCTTAVAPHHCDSRHWVVAAFSERQVLLEGWTATPRATEVAPHGRDSITVDYWHPDLLRLNDGFIKHPSAGAARQLYALGVRWIYADHTRPYARAMEPFAILRYSNPGVDVYQLSRQ